MKFMIFALFSVLLTAAPIDKTIDELLENEEQKELGISKYDPFHRTQPLLHKKTKKVKTAKKREAQVSAIMNDKAFIDGRWYKKGDVISEGKIIKISSYYVVLKKGTKTKTLKLQSHKKMFKIDEKDVQ